MDWNYDLIDKVVRYGIGIVATVGFGTSLIMMIKDLRKGKERKASMVSILLILILVAIAVSEVI